jgi:kumamolisin
MPDLYLVPLPGSEQRQLPNAQPAGDLDPDAPASATLVVRRLANIPSELITGPHTLSADELAARYGADPADVELVTSTLEGLGMTVSDVHLGRRRMTVTGTVAALSAAFGTHLALVSSEYADGSGRVTHRYRVGGLSVPEALSGVVTAVLGLDDRPVARPHFQLPDLAGPATQAPLTALQVAMAYQFPVGADGSGQTIAIIELGGGYRASDIDQYFSSLGLAGPPISSVGVNGGSNSPGEHADMEVLLDIEVVGAVAPAATQKVYFAPNSDAGFVDAISQAVHETPTPIAVSISWGQREDAWSAQSRTSMDSVFADAAALGVTITVASGDNGSADGASDGRQHCDFPASSPHVLACGGTRLEITASGAIATETVWNDTAVSTRSGGASGGGYSDVFPVPPWQADATGSADPARGAGVPDVAGNADPVTGYKIVANGQSTVVGGTGAVAPLWAGLVALLAQLSGKRFGLLQPLIYAGVTAGTPAPGFNDITSGNNGAYPASSGWDPCTGLGSPNSPALMALLGVSAVQPGGGSTDQGSGRPEARATSDRWTIVDELGYNVYADALADFILNPKTPTPLAISIKGEWGTGKTSLMRMLRNRIDPLSTDGEDPVDPLSPDGEDPVPGAAAEGETKPPTNGDVLDELDVPAEKRNLVVERSPKDRPAPTRRPGQSGRPRRSGLPSIWFNAWIYQSSRQLWAGLAVAIINGVASRMSFFERERFW